MTLIYLDTETTGLDPAKHEVWEVAYAEEGEPIVSGIVAHVGISADPEALRINGYHDRDGGAWDANVARYVEDGLWQAVHGATLVGANPRFDTAFLEARWGSSPWHYRLFDIEAYAMGALGFSEPKGLRVIAGTLRSEHDFDIPHPDHTAAGDVATLRACHLALRDMYAVAGGLR